MYILQTLMTSVPVRRVLGLVLALGNYMNGGKVVYKCFRMACRKFCIFYLTLLPKTLNRFKKKNTASNSSAMPNGCRNAANSV